MSGEKLGGGVNGGNDAWDSLNNPGEGGASPERKINATPEEIQELEDKFKNIDDWLRVGRIDQARADAMKKELQDQFDAAHAEKPIELDAELQADLDDKKRDIARWLKTGRISEEQADKMIAEETARAEEQMRKKLNAEGDIDAGTSGPDGAKSGTPPLDDQAKLELDEQHKLDLDEQHKLDLEEQEKLGLSEREKLAREREELLAEQRRLAAKLGLVAVNADFTHDRDTMAAELAKQQVDAEAASGGLIKGFFNGLWKGNLARKYYEAKYTREFIEGTRKTAEGQTLDEQIASTSGSAMERFILGAVDEMGGIKDSAYIHGKAGEKLEVDKETTEKIRPVIEKFVTEHREELVSGTNLKDLKLKLDEEIGRATAKSEDEGKPLNKAMVNNYLEVARQAAMRMTHEMGIEQVMEGFAVYNAEARDDIRTEAHRDRLDKITNWLQTRKIGNTTIDTIIPAEIIAGAVGIASAFSRTAVGATLGPAAGIGVGIVGSHLRERNRILEDRTQMLRDAANGLEHEGTARSKEEIKEIKGRAARKRAKYEAKIGGTVYQMESASSLTTKLTEAMAMKEGEERTKALLSAIKEARVRVDFSDSEAKDLISYSSAKDRGTERLELDKALITAERSLSEEDRKTLAEMESVLQKEISEGVSSKDKDFGRKRAGMLAWRTGKTIVFAAVNYLVGQEISAINDPTRIGILEKLGKVNTQNNADAKETLIASGFGFARGEYQVSPEQIQTATVRGDDKVVMEQYERAGFTKTEVESGWTETSTTYQSVPANESTAAIHVKYDGWANNGTTVSDGNELRAYLQNGQLVSGMSGNSTMGGQVFNYEELAAAGRIKGYVTIGGAKFELAGSANSAGQLTWLNNGIATTATGETIKVIGDNGEKLYKYLEIAVDNGVKDGVHHIVPLATDIGRDSVNATVMQAVTSVIEHPAKYEFSKVISEAAFAARGVSLAGGFGFAPELGRTGLGAARPASETPSDEGPTVLINPTPGYNGGTPAREEAPAETSGTPAPEAVTEQPAERPPEQPAEPSLEEAVEATRNGQINELVNSHITDENRGYLGGDEATQNTGLGFLTSANTMELSDTDRYATWWNTLNAEQKQGVRSLIDELEEEERYTNSGLGNGFRNWVHGQSIL